MKIFVENKITLQKYIYLNSFIVSDGSIHLLLLDTLRNSLFVREVDDYVMHNYEFKVEESR